MKIWIIVLKNWIRARPRRFWITVGLFWGGLVLALIPGLIKGLSVVIGDIAAGMSNGSITQKRATLYAEGVLFSALFIGIWVGAFRALFPGFGARVWRFFKRSKQNGDQITT